MSIDWICQKAHRKIRNRKNEQKEFMTCLEAGICPSCGKDLRVAEYAVTGDKRVICDKGDVLVAPNGVDFQFLNCEVWQRCINNDIRTAATKH